MDYVQERVATLHDFGDADPDASTDDATLVVPMTEQEYGGPAAERALSALEGVDLDRIVVPIRASAELIGEFADWLEAFSLPLDVLWCTGPRVADRLADADLDGSSGKGRDVWLGLGVSLEADPAHVALHDADARVPVARNVRKLLHPLDAGFAFSKAYYARVEDGTLYGRLCRLFYEPLVAALAADHDAPILDYLDAFRYGLSGECAMTAGVARSMRVGRGWEFEVGALGEAFAAAGFARTAQVDLGWYRHDHRSVRGSAGLAGMSEGVGSALARVIEEAGVDPDYDRLRERYREAAARHVRGYAATADFNGLAYDRGDELDQAETYATSVGPPGPDTRLPAWADAPVDAGAIREAAAADLAAAREAHGGGRSGDR